MSQDLENNIRKYALQNAAFYKGRANPKAVIGKVMADMPEIRSRSKEIVPLINAVVDEINQLTEEQQRAQLEAMDPSMLERRHNERTTGLAELPGAVDGGVVMRIAPNPSGPLHLGHTRVAILNDEYVRRYHGTYISRVEDTNPEKVYPDAYDMIPEELEWLGVHVHRTVVQSDRFDIYYDIARQLVDMGKAYVCTCPAEQWRDLKVHGKACPHRELSIEEQMEAFDRLMEGRFAAGEAILVVKTDLSHPNPAVRDFVGLRIVDQPHPRTGDRYHLYPMMNLSVAIDDHLLGLTHVIRGKDHLNNTLRQEYIFEYFGWKRPWYHHYGLVKIPDTVLKTSIIRQGIIDGEYTGWDDVRTGTVQALKRRGIRPEAIRRYWVDVGLKTVDIQFSWDNLYAMDKDLIDPEANRYFFVKDPMPLWIDGVDHLESRAPLHPDHPERGIRECVMESPINVYLTPDDMARLRLEDRLRLKDLCNVRMDGDDVLYDDDDLDVLKQGVRISHWAPDHSVACSVLMPTGKSVSGLCEPLPDTELGRVVQFERFGFVRLESMIDDEIAAVFTHR